MATSSGPTCFGAEQSVRPALGSCTGTAGGALRPKPRRRTQARALDGVSELLVYCGSLGALWLGMGDISGYELVLYARPITQQ